MTRRAFLALGVIRFAGKWLVETEITFLCRTAILYRTNAGQIVVKVLGGYPKKNFTKIQKKYLVCRRQNHVTRST